MLERTEALDALRAAAAGAAAGRGSVVVIAGEAGIGRTSVVRAFTREVRGRVLTATCDDLLVPRPLGPLRDAMPSVGDMFDGVLAELAAVRPTVLVVEDAHWADDATLDVLGYLARRIATVPAVLVMTVRDGPAAGRLHHTALRLSPLSPAAVAELTTETDWDGARLHALTGGNPFLVTEMLTAREGTVPVTVARAVHARMARLSEPCQSAVEKLSVVLGTIGFTLAERLLGDDVTTLTEAEEHGLLDVLTDGLAFRHEVVRQAVQAGLPRLRHRSLHRAVLDLLSTSDSPDLPALVRHAVGAGDPDAARHALLAGREAMTHDEALAHLTTAARHQHRLDLAERARLADDLGWELHHARRPFEAVAAGERAVRLFTELGDLPAAGHARAHLAQHHFLAGDTARAEVVAWQALHPVADATTVTHYGAVLALTGDTAEAVGALDQAEALAREEGRTDLLGLGLIHQSIARPDLDDEERLVLLRESLELALQHGHHALAARAYAHLGELLHRLARYGELERCLTAGLAFAERHGLHVDALRVHDRLLRIRRGDWRDAGHPRVLARRGEGDRLRSDWRRALRRRSLTDLGHAGAALAEYAWLTGRPEIAEAVHAGWRDHADRPGAAPLWAEVLRYCARAGLPVAPFDGCPEPWAAGLRGDWRAAAEGWARIGDPYERALELAESGEAEPTLAALRTLDDLGATAAAAIVRRRLRDLGVRTIPRGPSTSTQAHPAGLTTRQNDVLALLADGLTNAEIAGKLFLSVRTVDHHVSAILTKLGVTSRRQAAATARNLVATMLG